MRRSKNKSDILLKLEPLSSKKYIVSRVEVKPIDGSALTQTLDPKEYQRINLKDFKDSADTFFL